MTIGFNKQLYGRWRHILERCYCPWRKDYKYYGAKGVGVSEEWHEYGNFKDWFVNTLSGRECDGLVVDRIDPRYGYGPNNCRLITVRENAQRAIKCRDAKGRFAIGKDK